MQIDALHGWREIIAAPLPSIEAGITIREGRVTPAPGEVLAEPGR